MKRHFVLCGCSGPVGKMLIARLGPHVRLTLVGRNPGALAASYPGHEVCGYEELEEAVQDADLVINLAALNNDAASDYAHFLEVNRDLALDLARRTKQAGSARFLFLSSFHALSGGLGFYGKSKAAGERALSEEPGLKLLILRIPAVYGEEISGRLAKVQRLPKWLRSTAMQALAAVKPVVSAERLAAFLLDSACDWPDDVTELSDAQSGNLFYATAQRVVDLGFAFAAIVLLWWVFVGVWIAIRFESEGPAIFRQTRVGRGNQPFECYKFRTMTMGTRQTGTHEVDAAAITRVGRWLRRTKIDELPQVVNMLRSEVSLVGPRPCLPVQDELVSERLRRGVMGVAPGITGLAQVNDIDMSAPRLLAQWDRRYVMSRSIVADLKLVFATLSGKGQGDRIREEATGRAGPQG